MIKNLKETRELIALYRSITEEQVERAIRLAPLSVALDPQYNFAAKKQLTGFGDISRCKLCVAVGETTNGELNCKDCIHYFNDPDYDGYPCLNHITYSGIRNADSPKDIVKAYRNRADYLESLLKPQQFDYKET